MSLSRDQLAALAAELCLSEERVRRHIARQLHDHVIQNLALGKVKLDMAVQRNDLARTNAVEELQRILETSMQDIRDLCIDLSPPVLYELGLKAALQSLGDRLAKEFGFVFELECEAELPVSEELKVTLFQLARELLLNMLKHSGAASAKVLVQSGGSLARLEVADDGVGFDPASCRPGFGLASVRQRVVHLGSLLIQSAPGAGTRVEILLNLEPRG